MWYALSVQMLVNFDVSMKLTKVFCRVEPSSHSFPLGTWSLSAWGFLRLPYILCSGRWSRFVWPMTFSVGSRPNLDRRAKLMLPHGLYVYVRTWVVRMRNPVATFFVWTSYSPLCCFKSPLEAVRDWITFVILQRALWWIISTQPWCLSIWIGISRRSGYH